MYQCVNTMIHRNFLAATAPGAKPDEARLPCGWSPGDYRDLLPVLGGWGGLGFEGEPRLGEEAVEP